MLQSAGGAVGAVGAGRDKLTCSQYLDKRLFVQLNGSRKVIGVLRGYDVRNPDSKTVLHERLIVWQVYLNIVLDEAVEEKDGGEKIRLGMVVRILSCASAFWEKFSQLTFSRSFAVTR